MDTTSPSKKTVRVNNQENRTIREKNRNSSSNAGGLIWHKIWLTLQINERSLKQDFFATWLGQEEKVILGHPWLTTYNPTIYWISGKVTLRRDTPPHSPMRSPTPWRQQSPRTHPYSWIVPPHQALGGRLCYSVCVISSLAAHTQV